MTVADMESVRLNFSPESLRLMNAILGFIVFGVALSIDFSDFKDVLRKPIALLAGLCTQFFIFPAITYLLVMILQPLPGLALGMLLVSSCPGGNISNFLTNYCGGNTALSISMSTLSTLGATLMTPLNMIFWSNLYLSHNESITFFTLSFVDMVYLVSVLLLIPTVLGMTMRVRYPDLAKKLYGPIQKMSLLIFIGFVIFALHANWHYFLKYYHIILSIVLIHNLIAMFLGYSIALTIQQNFANRKAITIEIAIQNSGLGLIIIFNEMDGHGAMAIVAAAWGIWHLISGLALASFWHHKMRTDPIPQ